MPWPRKGTLLPPSPMKPSAKPSRSAQARQCSQISEGMAPGRRFSPTQACTSMQKAWARITESGMEAAGPAQ